MILIDVEALTPPGIKPDEWLPILKAAWGHDKEYVMPHTRLGWLKRITEDQVWGEVTVQTSRSGWLFWRRSSDRVDILDEQGKRLPKPKRPRHEDEWAYGLVLGTDQKALIAKAMKHPSPAQQAAVKRLKDEYQLGHSNGQELYETDGEYQLVTEQSYSQVTTLLYDHVARGGWWAWDSETDDTGEEDLDAPNPYTARLVGISIAIRPKHAWYFPIAHRDEAGELLAEGNLPLARVLQVLEIMYLGTVTQQGQYALVHNAKYDISVYCNQVQQGSVHRAYTDWLPKTQDTMLMAAVANEQAGLKPLAQHMLGLQTIDFKKLTRGKPFSYVPLEHAKVYAGQDADWLLRLFPLLKARLQDLECWDVYRAQELPLTEYWMRMERRGFLIDQSALQRLQDETVRDRDHARTWFIQLLRHEGLQVPQDLNLGSGQQVKPLIFGAGNSLALPVIERTETGEPSLSKKALNQLKANGINHPALTAYRNWTRAQKRLSAFIQPLWTMIQADGRVRGSYHAIGAQTGRTSMRNPNGQQFEKALRQCIIAAPEHNQQEQHSQRDSQRDNQHQCGEMVSIDYSQIELRVLAAEFHEPKMLATFALPPTLPDGSENPDADIHSTTQREVRLATRTLAKNFNFGKAFGAGPGTLSITAGIPRSQAERFSRQFDLAYPDYAGNLKQRQAEDMRQGFTRNWRGRIRILPLPVSEQQRQTNLRLISNTPVQGGALDIIKWAMNRILPLLPEVEPFGIHPFNMVHDELDFECEWWTPEELWHIFIRTVQELMEDSNPYQGLVPLYTDVEVGYNWGDLRKVDADALGIDVFEEALT